MNLSSDSNFQSLLQQALAETNQGSYQQAEQLYRQILLADPDHPEALQLLGLTLSQQGDSQQALHYLQRATDLAPQQARFHQDLGLVYQHLGQTP